MKHKKFTVGQKLVLLHAPRALLSGLPKEDQAEIRRQTGKRLNFEGYDKFGNVELMFTGSDKTTHFIWVKETFVSLPKTPIRSTKR